MAMASSSSPHGPHPWKRKCSSPDPSSFPFPVSISPSFLRQNKNGRRPRGLLTSSSSSSSFKCADGTPNPDQRNSNNTPSIPTTTATSSPVAGGDVSFSFIDRFSRSNWHLKLFRRRSLWKRIFFASKKVRSIILLNVLAVIYASNIPVVKEVEAVMDPALFNVVRFAISAIPFIPHVLEARGDHQTRSAGIELGFWVSLGYLSQALGLLTSDAGRASFISAFTVIVVPFIDGLFGTKVPMLTWYGAIISLIGVAMLESSGSPPSVGDLLNIMSAVFFGIHMLRTEHISRVTKKEKFLALLGYEVCVIALSSVFWYFSRGIFGDVHPGNSAECTGVWDCIVSFPWVPALYTGIFSTGLCLWAEISAMRDVSATETAIIYGLEPLWGAGFAWFLLGERWGTTGWIGAALVLGGSLTVQILESTPDKSKKDGQGKLDALDVVNNLDNFSLSTVVVTSRKNVRNLLKKQDKG